MSEATGADGDLGGIDEQGSAGLRVWIPRVSAARGSLTILIIALAIVANSGADVPHLLLYEQMRERGERSLAVDGYERLITTGQLGILPSLGLANTYLDWGRNAQAVEAFALALTVDPTNFDALSGTGNALLAQRKWPEAAEAWGRAVAVRPSSTEARYNLGLARLRQGQFAEARRVLGDLVADPDVVGPRGPAHYRLGQLLMLEASDVQALHVVAEHLRLADGEDGERVGAELALAVLAAGETAPEGLRWALLGYAQVRVGEWEFAASLFERAVAHPPTDPSVLAYLGYAWWRVGRGDEALEVLTRAPESPLSRYYLGVIRRERGETGEAVAELSRAVELDPENADLWTELARTYLVAADYAGAEHSLREAARLAPGEASRHVALATFYLDHALGLPQAVASARQAVQSDPASAETQYVLGWALSLSGSLKEAEPALRRAIQLAPGFPSPRYHLGQLLAKTGRAQAAREQYRRTIDLDQSGRYADLARKAMEQLR